MSFCCEDALAVYEERHRTDSHPRIVRVVLPGAPFHAYYRSSQIVWNLTNSPIPPYAGPARFAPKEHYGPGTFMVDEELMAIARSAAR